jgi:hypothetical protein
VEGPQVGPDIEGLSGHHRLPASLGNFNSAARVPLEHLGKLQGTAIEMPAGEDIVVTAVRRRSR